MELAAGISGYKCTSFKMFGESTSNALFVGSTRHWMKQMYIGLNPVDSKYTRNRCMIGGCTINYRGGPYSRGTCQFVWPPPRKNNHKATRAIFSFIHKQVNQTILNYSKGNCWSKCTCSDGNCQNSAHTAHTQNVFCVFLSPVDMKSSLVLMNVLWFELLIGSCYFIVFCSTVCACFSAKCADLVTWSSWGS